MAVARQLLAALDCMHGAGVVHCDIKESNILIESGGEDGNALHLWITDFDAALDKSVQTNLLRTVFTTYRLRGITALPLLPPELERILDGR
uniref:Protein kinase domain-containing protein n=1 Tax=Chromera velia CCMP2878 TaxID=1169474 RepID=A0A0G4IG61_9ALVE|eukprot:Cvel_143.t1-p1 / transcript=Cvel_143.t1 / gene=Cvel_143 / organism=Chromera_velia_CCMP2878 / gene_product=hypothetical protein / transcript_product=hypothetical protein / location=Cvel_scaffold9:243349-244144(-) / protein_length=90 / sequence_SO=supercontig / SO=protein_coding / is_pseudo=false